MLFSFENSYAKLPAHFYARQDPVPVKAPKLIKINEQLARDLGLDPAALAQPDGIATLAGNHVPYGAEPLAQAYAGHQFAGWSPQLGDGRAVLLGEVVDRFGQKQDIQLKGSGPTAFSRNGDGRAWLGPVLREYLVSEAMHALGIPTTRALAAVSTGQNVQRETALPGAILTRVASSHIRVGTFQYFAARQDHAALQTLCDYTIARHFSEADSAMDLLEAAVAAQAQLIAQWMAVGFIHGVMNTDNCHVAGLTIDYGPCAFLDTYEPSKTYSAIDRHGRYAYQNQPDIAVWNLAQFATSLLPLMGPDQKASIAAATAAIHRFEPQFQAAWGRQFRTKIGLQTSEDGDFALLSELLNCMAQGDADFTNTFRGLSDGQARECFADPSLIDPWLEKYQARLAREKTPVEIAQKAVKHSTPALIPRTHLIEAAIQAAVAGDFAPFHRLNTALASPFSAPESDLDLRQPPREDQKVHQTFCGT